MLKLYYSLKQWPIHLLIGETATTTVVVVVVVVVAQAVL